MERKYDTGAKYWVPPGFSAFKDEKGIFFGILINVLLVFLIDSFLLHPIAPPKGTYDIHATGAFTAVAVPPQYENAAVLSQTLAETEKEIVLLQQDGETHLLVMDYTAPLMRLKLQKDIVLESSFTGTKRVGSGLFYADISVKDGAAIENVMLSPFSFSENSYTYALYILLGIVLGIAESWVYGIVCRKRRK